jgi:hypothetical protein
MLIPHRTPDVEETILPPDYQRILAAVRQAAGRSWPARSARRWASTSSRGPGWNRCGGGWSDSLIAPLSPRRGALMALR